MLSPRNTVYSKVVFLIPPTGAYCREGRCQSFFHADLVPTMRPPMEECEAAGAIAAVGSQAEIIDAPAHKLDIRETLRQLQASSPDLLILVATFGSLEADLQWGRRIREALPEVIIGLRGAPAYVYSEKILRRQAEIDFCLRGEYEIVFQTLVKQGYRDCPGVCYLQAGKLREIKPVPLAEDLDDLPFPDRSAIDSSRYRVRGLRKAQATIRVQRGCSFPCSYCLVHTVSGSRVRHRSPESVVAEMQAVMASKTRFFYLRADTFSINKKWVMRLTEALARECPTARWVTTTRVECVDDEILAACRAAGCYGISFGVDVASASIGAKVNKEPRKACAQTAMRLCDRYGIISLAYFMIGFIWETRETLAETAQFIRDIRSDLITIHFAHPYPGTQYYRDFKEQAGSVLSQRAQSEPAAHVGELTTQELKQQAGNMLKKHYRRPSVIYSLAKKGLPLYLESLRG